MLNLENILKEMMHSFKEEKNVNYKDIKKKTNLFEEKNNNIENIFHQLKFELEDFLEAMINSEISSNENVVFIYNNFSFIENHLEYLFQKFEGNNSCSDKANIVIGKLIDYFHKNKEVYFDYNQRYTFHLPKKILTTQEEILKFYYYLVELFYGQYENYFKFIKNLDEKYEK